MATIGTLMAYIGADTTDLVRGVRDSERHLKQFERNASASTKRASDAFQTAARSFSSSMRGLGATSKLTSAEIQKLGQRFNTTFAKQEARRHLENLAKTTGMTRLETARFQAQLGNYKGAFSTLVFESTRAKIALAALATGTVLALKRMAGSTLEVATSFEDMEKKLNVLTNGQGKQTLEELNAWALRMPVNTQKAVDTFGQMVAYGLKPTIDQMTILVDVATILGDEALPSVARALGQMQSFGKLTAQDINQLAQAGINARKILADAFGGQTLEEIQASGVAIEKVIDALWKGMKNQFGGAATQAMDSWRGLKTVFQSYITEIQRASMAGGAFDRLKSVLRDVNENLEKNIDDYIRLADNLATVAAMALQAANAVGTLVAKLSRYEVIAARTSALNPLTLLEGYRTFNPKTPPENQAGKRFPMPSPPETNQSAGAVDKLTKSLSEYVGLLERNAFKFQDIQLLAEGGEISEFQAIRREVQAYGEQLVILKDQMERTEPETKKWFELRSAVLEAETAITTLGRTYLDLEQNIKTLALNDVLDNINVALAQGDINESRAVEERIKVYERMVSVYEDGLSVHKEFTEGWFNQKKLINDAKLKLAELTKEVSTGNKYLASAETYHLGNLSLIKQTNDKIGSRLSLLGEEKQTLEQTLVPVEKRLELETRIAEAQAWAQGEVVESLERTAEKQEKVATEMEKLWLHTMENIHDATADAFYDAFDKGFDAFNDFMDEMKDLFKRTLAEIIAHAATQKVILPVLMQTVGQFMPGIGNAISGMYGGDVPSVPGLGFLGNGFGATTIGGALGGGLLGYLGYSTIGGMLGLPQGKHSGLGAGIGAGIGSFFGPVGTIVGGLLGGLGGSLFGDGYDDADAALVLGARGTGSEYINQASNRFNFASQAKDFGHQEGQVNQAVVEYFDGLFGVLSDQFNVSIDRILGGNTAVFHFDKAERIIENEGIEGLLKRYTDRFLESYGEQLTGALKSSISQMIPGIALDMDSAVFRQLENLQSTEQLDQALTSISQVIQQIQSITQPIDDFLATADMSDTEKAIWSINRQYETYRETLQSLGVDLTKYVKLEQWRSKQLQQIMQNAEANAQSQIDALLAQQDEIRKRVFAERDSVVNSIDDMIRNLRFGEYAPVQSIEAFENKFNEMFNAAKSGTQQDVEDLLQYIPQYLEFMSGAGDMQFLTERIAQRLEELKPAVETNYQELLVKETQGVQNQLVEIQKELERVRAAINSANQITYNTPESTGGGTSYGPTPVSSPRTSTYSKTLVDYLRSIEQQYGRAYVEQYFGPNSSYGENRDMRSAFRQLYGYEEGGYTGNQIGLVHPHEWVMPTIEPQKSNFLRDTGIEDAIKEAVGGGVIHVHVNIDGREIGNVMVDQLVQNGRLVSKVRKVAGR